MPRSIAPISSPIPIPISTSPIIPARDLNKPSQSPPPSPPVTKPSTPLKTRMTTVLKIRKFGGRADENVEQFLSSVKIVVDLEAEERAKTMSPQVRAYYIQSHLEDKAARFAANLPASVVSDWEQLSKALKDKFRNNPADEASRRQAQDALLELRQEPGVSLEGYYKQVKKIARNLRPEDEHYATSKFIKGLAKKRLRTHATTAIPYGSSLDDAISVVKRLVPVICLDLSARDGQSDEEDESDNSEDSDDSEDEKVRKSRRRPAKKSRKPAKRSSEDTVSKFEFMKEVEELRALLKESLKTQLNAATPPVPPAPPHLVDAFAVNRLVQPPASYPQPYSAFRAPQNFQYAPPVPGRQLFGQGFQGGYAPRAPRDRSTITCFGCGQLGHYRSECPLNPMAGGMQHFPGAQGSTFPNQESNQGQRAPGQFQGQPPHGPRPGYYSQGGPGIARGGQEFPLPSGDRIQEIHPDGPGGGQRASMAAAVDVASSALDGVVVHVADDNIEGFVQELENEPEGQQEAMAGERVRTRSQLTSSGSAGEGPSRHRQKGLDGEPVRDTAEPAVPGRVYAPMKKQRKKGRVRVYEHKPIRLMRGRPAYDFIDAFRGAPVTDLTWGSLMDIAPVIRRDIAHQLVQERVRRLAPREKGKQAEAAMVAEEPPNQVPEEVVNFYTSAKANVGARTFNLNHVLVDAGSVINLAPISVLEKIGVRLQPTRDLVIRTATSSLVSIDWFADLTIEVAGVPTPIRVYAIPGNCKPTFAMLLSGRWLRACEAIGDYTAETYVIRDKSGRRHQVPRESLTSRQQPHRVHLNPSTANVDLEEEVIAELELDTFNTASVRKLALQIAREVDSELTSYEKHFGDHDSAYLLTDDETTSGPASSSTSDSYGGASDGSDLKSENWSSW